MKTAHVTKLLGIAAAMFFVLSGRAHASDPAGTFKRYSLASFPSSGANKGKYAEAWADLITNNCGKSGTNVPLCYEAKASLQGKVMNAQIEALNAAGHVRQNLSSKTWDWGYSVAVFGSTLVKPSGSVGLANVAANVVYGQPLISQDNPYAERGQVNLSIDLGLVSSWLSVLPDAKITVHYLLWGGFTTKLDLMASSPYGALAWLKVQPRGSMQASCNTTYTAGPVRAHLVTPANVQVIAPSSDVRLDAAIAFAHGYDNKATVTVTPNLRLLKGQVNYSVDGWLNPAGQLVDIGSEIICFGGLFCDGTSAAWVQVDSGSVWSQTASYALYMNSGTTTTLFSGTLPGLSQLTF